MKRIFLLATLSLLALSSCSRAPTKSIPGEAPMAPAGGPEEEARRALEGAQQAAQGPCEAYRGRGPAKDFAGYDADENKAVSRDEYLCQVIGRFTELNGDHDPFLAGAELSGRPAWAADANKDKRVSLVEFVKGAESAFQRADGNKNGSLSAAEFGKGKL